MCVFKGQIFVRLNETRLVSDTIYLLLGFRFWRLFFLLYLHGRQDEKTDRKINIG